MQVVNADDILARENLTKLFLNILTEDGSLSDIYFLQPCGEISADADGVRVTSPRFDQKVSNFITSFAEYGDLLSTPEYCCPWSLITEINNGLSPKEHGIWALGFQSITPSSLETIVSENQNLKWIIEYPEAGTHTFLNPLIYFLDCRRVFD